MGEKTEKGVPRRLDTWRITSPTKELIEQAAGLYGGEPKPWESPTGPQWDVVTTTSELPVLVMPGYSFRQGYEFRTSPTLVERRCDGSEMDDGRPCLCNAEGEDKCALLTRLTVALPELTTMLGWRLETKGENAARELLASIDLVQGVAGGRPFVPARLRIVERRGNVNGQAVRYVVPVIDVSLRYSQVLGGELTPREQAALPTGYTPIEARATNGVTLAEGLREAETQTLRKQPRVQLPEDDEILGDDPGASPGADGAPAPSSPAGEPAAPQATDEYRPTKAMLEKLNALVGQLRDSGQITTEQLWAALAKVRSVGVEEMVELLRGRDEDGVLHWSPLRDSLTRGEARDLHSRLADKWVQVQAAEVEDV